MKRQIIAIMMLALMIFAGNAIAEDSLEFLNQITTEDAFTEVVYNENVFLLDVRTPEEWIWVGHPGVNGTGYGEELEGYVVNISYKVHHKGKSKSEELIVNSKFVRDVERLFYKDDKLILMCRSGGRSTAAAFDLEAVGFTNVWNMTEGFEGQTDADGYRTQTGWKVDTMPYNNSKEGVYKD